MAGALDGAVAAPFSTAGGMAASAITSTATKVGTIVAVEAAGGAVSGGVTDSESKAANSEEVTWGSIGKAALGGAVAGAIGARAGQATGKLAKVGTKTVNGVTSKTGMVVRTGVKTAGGTAAGSGGAALAQVIENAIERGKIKKEDFIKAMTEQGIDKKDTEEVWTLLCDNGVIKDEKAQHHLPDSLKFPEALEHCRTLV